MSLHLYHVGDAVTLTPHSGNYLKTPGAYVVSALMPPLGDVLQYRIKSASEPYERVVAEHQLNRLETESPPEEPNVATPKATAKNWAGRGIRAASAAPPRRRAAARSQ